MNARLMISVAAVLLSASACARMCSAASGDYYVVLTPDTPTTPWNDFHFTSESWWHPVFGSGGALIRTQTVPIQDVTLTYDGSVLDRGIVEGNTQSTQTGGSLGLTVATQTQFAWAWSTCYWYLTFHENGQTFIRGSGTFVPIPISGVSMLYSSGTVSLSAASESGATVSQVMYASSNTFYATPAELDNAGILAGVTPIISALQTTPIEIFATHASGLYAYSRTTFSDGSVYFAAGGVVPAPAGAVMLSTGGVMLAFRRRR